MSSKKNEKKKSASNKKAQAKTGSASAEAAVRPAKEKRAAATNDTGGDTASATAQPREPDKRIPPTGTVIKKVDRHGKVRCECRVVEGGFFYNRTTYPSLSAAAMAAANDLDLKNKTQNGFTFWGLSKSPRPPSDPVEALTQAVERFHSRADAVKDAVTDDNRPKVKAVMLKHQQKLEALLEAVG
jgi:hypothetical protein